MRAFLSELSVEKIAPAKENRLGVEGRGGQVWRHRYTGSMDFTIDPHRTTKVTTETIAIKTQGKRKAS